MFITRIFAQQWFMCMLHGIQTTFKYISIQYYESCQRVKQSQCYNNGKILLNINNRESNINHHACQASSLLSGNSYSTSILPTHEAIISVYFLNAAHATSQGRWTNLEESAIYTHPHTQAHSHPGLAIDALTATVEVIVHEWTLEWLQS